MSFFFIKFLSKILDYNFVCIILNFFLPKMFHSKYVMINLQFRPTLMHMHTAATAHTKYLYKHIEIKTYNLKFTIKVSHN